MASSAPRPPEDPVKSGDFNENIDKQPVIVDAGANTESNGNAEQMSDVNANMKTEQRDARVGATRRPTSLPPGNLTNNTGAQRKRASYHQDVEEALSSLLWQPYEYRTQSDSSDTLSTLSLSTGSSSSTSLSYEYATMGKNAGLLHSFTDEFLNVASLYASAGNAADPNLRPRSVQSAQMVSNLMSGVGSQCGRGASGARSVRGGSAHTPLSQVDSARSRVRELVSRCARIKTNKDVSVATASASAVGVNCDDVQVSGAMRVEIPGAGAGALSIHSDMIPSSMTSVVSANVVGLPVPVHSRSSSTLSAARGGGGGGMDINHPRSVSDSANVFVQHGVHYRHPSLPPAPSVSVQHVRAASETSQPPAQPQPSSDTHILHTRQESQPSRVPPLPNVSNVNVNFYRAVPVNVVSNVPTIQCVNSVEETLGNNVSNVHIVQAMPPPTLPTTTQQVLVHSHPQPQPPPAATTVTEVRTRTFTSTEAQTDDTTVGTIVSPTVVPNVNREQRRRERRERRHQRRVNNHPHQPQSHPQSQQTTQNVQSQQQSSQVAPWPSQGNDRLPDLLNSHLPPPYSTLPGGVPPPMAMVGPPPPPPGTMVSFPPGVVPVVQAAPPPVPVPVPVAVPQPHSGFRFPFPNANGFRRCRSRLGPRYSTEEHQPKSCCGFLVSRPGSLRWFIALIALVAVCCVLVGTVLGAMRPAGRDHLTVSLLMIGVGIVLVTVSGVAWRLTSHDAPSCRAMLGLESGDTGDVCTRRFVPRLPPSYGRPHHPYAAMIYPEFQYRPPPPSYQASMQEYRLRLLLLDRAGNQQQPVQHAVSPPPTYRSHAGSLLRAPLSNRRDATQSEYSCPPSYRSRSSTNRQPSVDPAAHSREQSLSISESNHDGSVVNVVNILANQEEEIALENMTLDSLKVAPENEIPPLRMLLKSGSGSDLEAKDGNLVTIVQKADQNPVIVTVSGSQMSTTNPEVGSSNQIPSEMEILAHL